MKRIACLDEPNKEQISFLARKYDPLDFAPNLRALLSRVYSNIDFLDYSKIDLHKLLNKLLLHGQYGEQVLKYELFKLAARKKDVIAAFEVPVNKSRADFLTVNGVTTSYEIKSDLDNLTKLAKQATDYTLAFEYNYVVIHEKHLKNVIKIIPDTFGVLCYQDGTQIEHRKASLNTKIDPRIQLTLLTKKEIATAFGKGFNIESALAFFSDEEINNGFKRILKERYRPRWEFIIDNKAAILPIDIQFFFNCNIEPKIVYCQ